MLQSFIPALQAVQWKRSIDYLTKVFASQVIDKLIKASLPTCKHVQLSFSMVEVLL